MSKKHIIIDWETVDNASRRPMSATPSCAVLVFDPEEILSFEELVANARRFKFNLDEQFTTMGRTYDEATVGWWNKPEQAEARKLVIEPSEIDVSLREFFPELRKYLAEMGYDANDPDSVGFAWSRGNAFDFALYYNILEYFKEDDPFPWWSIRDTRTEIDAVTPYWDDNHDFKGYVRKEVFPWPAGVVKHVETHDIALDVLQMQFTHMKLIEHIENTGKTVEDVLRERENA